MTVKMFLVPALPHTSYKGRAEHLEKWCHVENEYGRVRVAWLDSRMNVETVRSEAKVTRKVEKNGIMVKS